MFRAYVIILLCLGLLSASLPLSATHADVLPIEKPPIFIHYCEGAQTPADMQTCNQSRFEAAESMLNVQFSKLLHLFKDTIYREKLQNAQNNWLSYRNRECDFESHFFEDGAARRTIELSCLGRLSEARALHLYNLVPSVRIKEASAPEQLTPKEDIHE